jgi:UPF0271 protein
LLRIDMNCDLGESFGVYRLGNDEALLKHVTSANIACGYHAGDPSTMRKTVLECLRQGVQIGAHPGLPDLAGFGRRHMAVSPREAYDMVVYQIGALLGFVKSEGGLLRHVKPHGALYHMAAEDGKLAEAVAEAVYKVDAEMMVYGPSGSRLMESANRIGLRTANEVFADRTYRQDGTLTPRSMEGALIEEPEQAAAQVIRMVKQGTAMSREGVEVEVKADTVCVHGDGPHALDSVRIIRQRLEQEGIRVLAP